MYLFTILALRAQHEYHPLSSFMLFNSLGFAVFFPAVFFIYWLIGSTRLKLQNIFLLLASYYFYSNWDYRFLFLLIFSTALDFFSGLTIARASNINRKKAWLFLSIFVNISFLAVFKYYNFFAENFATLFSLIGVHLSYTTLKIVLPVGISFYTFHGLSYVIDVYKDRIKPESDFVDYSLFVSFFPLLVAGPIERATHLLPQIKRKRSFSYENAVDGLRQIMWGLFKKVVVADNFGAYTNLIFNNYHKYSASTLIFGAVSFSFQIYCDFSGYSDIALGTARLLGFDLLKNFSYPYFSRSVAEFWRRWHISLSSWFRDYIYFPLGGSRGAIWQKIRNVFIIFTISGFWHGANWTYIFWGALNSFYMLPSVLLNKNRQHLDIVAAGNTLPSIKEVFQIFYTFFLISVAWVFFRAASISDAFAYLKAIITFQHGAGRPTLGITALPLLLLFMILIEWIWREKNFALEKLQDFMPRPFRWCLYLSIILFIGFYMHSGTVEFIYFQF